MELSLVIGTYNQKEVLKKALLSLFLQTVSPEKYEIQLIDSSSTDGTDAMVEQLTPTCRFNYLRVPNRGKAAARNIGIGEAKGKIILLTDADMIANPQLVGEHLAAREKYKNGACEGLTINPDGQPYIRAKLKAGQKITWAYFLTGNLSLEKESLLKAGLFDEAFTGYGWEDLELGYRLHKMGVPLYYLPSAINYHDHPVTNEDMVKRKFAMGQAAALFYKKHPSLAVKYFLGMNPLAMGIFHLIKKSPRLQKHLSHQAGHLAIGQYLLEEYQYRLGLEEGLSS